MVMTARRGLRTALMPLYGRRLLTGLQAAWPLDNVNLADHARQGNTLTANNTPTAAAGPGGRKPYATQFTAASSQSLSLTDNPILSMGDIDMTFGVWCYPDNFTDTQRFVNKGDPNGAGGEYTMGHRGLESVWEIRVRNTADNAVTFLQVGDGGVPASAWYFLVFAHDSVNDLLKFSINGGDFSTTPCTGGILDGTSTFYISSSVGGGQFWDGRIAGVSLWKRLLTAAEITYLYNGGAGRDLVPGIGFQ